MIKKLTLLIFLYGLFGLSQISLADPEECAYLGKNPDMSATTFLTDCSRGTLGVSVGVGSSRDTITQKAKTIAQALISFGALLAVGAIVWSGIQYTKAMGEDENLKKAKTTGIYAIIGLLLLLLSFGLVDSFISFVYKIAGAT